MLVGPSIRTFCPEGSIYGEPAPELNFQNFITSPEWDPSKKRYRPVSTRDKLVKYPRIVTASPFPPIDENNCPELQYFVTTTKYFRDAIVHASASFDPVEDYPKKESLFVGLKQEEVSKIVDTAVVLVEKIETLVNGRPPKWLHRRGENGQFPDAVFE